MQFQNPGMQVAYPKTDISTSTIKAIVCDEDDAFECNAYNIPEPVSSQAVHPSEIDLVLLPLLAFDQQGYRVGYGKGFYDRFLQHCRKDCVKVGLSYFDAVPSIEDANEFDVPLDYCITPQKVYVF
jgi:5-formyltetrahydrofolate cyclo-ligase